MQRPVAAFLIVTTLEAFNRSSLTIGILVICSRQRPFGPCTTGLSAGSCSCRHGRVSGALGRGVRIYYCLCTSRSGISYEVSKSAVCSRNATIVGLVWCLEVKCSGDVQRIAPRNRGNSSARTCTPQHDATAISLRRLTRQPQHTCPTPDRPSCLTEPVSTDTMRSSR